MHRLDRDGPIYSFDQPTKEAFHVPTLKTLAHKLGRNFSLVYTL